MLLQNWHEYFFTRWHNFLFCFVLFENCGKRKIMTSSYCFQFMWMNCAIDYNFNGVGALPGKMKRTHLAKFPQQKFIHSSVLELNSSTEEHLFKRNITSDSNRIKLQEKWTEIHSRNRLKRRLLVCLSSIVLCHEKHCFLNVCTFREAWGCARAHCTC